MTPHRPQEKVQRVDSRRHLVGLDPADRGLVRPDAARQARLAETASLAGDSDQLSWSHLG
jgi:hypothetical protein